MAGIMFGFGIFIPIIYVMGFIFGIVMAAIYNLNRGLDRWD